MKESLHLKLEKLLERQEELEGLLADPETINNQNKFKELSQEYAEIKPIVSCFEKYIEVAKQIDVAPVARLPIIHIPRQSTIQPCS